MPGTARQMAIYVFHLVVVARRYDMIVEPIRVNMISMDMRAFRKLLLIWMIVWLPAAGALAAVMPLSGSMTSSSAPSIASTGEQDMAFMPCHGKSMTGKMALGQGCAHCVLCHLAGALVMPEMPTIAMVPPTHIFLAIPQASHRSFVPELIAPPPRLALA